MKIKKLTAEQTAGYFSADVRNPGDWVAKSWFRQNCFVTRIRICQRFFLKNIDKKSCLSYIIGLVFWQNIRLFRQTPSERKILRVRREPSRLSAQDKSCALGDTPAVCNKQIAQAVESYSKKCIGWGQSINSQRKYLCKYFQELEFRKTELWEKLGFQKYQKNFCIGT